MDSSEIMHLKIIEIIARKKYATPQAREKSARKFIKIQQESNWGSREHEMKFEICETKLWMKNLKFRWLKIQFTETSNLFLNFVDFFAFNFGFIIQVLSLMRIRIHPPRLQLHFSISIRSPRCINELVINTSLHFICWELACVTHKNGILCKFGRRWRGKHKQNWSQCKVFCFPNNFLSSKKGRNKWT